MLNKNLVVVEWEMAMQKGDTEVGTSVMFCKNISGGCNLVFDALCPEILTEFPCPVQLVQSGC